MNKNTEAWKDLQEEIYGLYEQASASLFYCEFGSKQYNQELESMQTYKLCADVIESHMPKQSKPRKLRK